MQDSVRTVETVSKIYNLLLMIISPYTVNNGIIMIIAYKPIIAPFKSKH